MSTTPSPRPRPELRAGLPGAAVGSTSERDRRRDTALARVLTRDAAILAALA